MWFPLIFFWASLSCGGIVFIGRVWLLFVRKFEKGRGDPGNRGSGGKYGNENPPTPAASKGSATEKTQDERCKKVRLGGAM